VVGDRAITCSAASAGQMGRFETKWLSRPENFAALADLPGHWIDKVHQRRPPKMIVLDMDSSESPTYGEQEGSAYNGHFGCTCYHPLFVFNQFGDVEQCVLRPGNVHSADGWRAVLEPVIARYRGSVKRLYIRGDAAFANPEMYEYLEAEGIGYAIRLPANRVLQDRIGYLLKRPGGQPPHDVRRYYASFSYQAQSGTRRATSWPRSSGIPASCTRASALSSPISHALPRASSPSTTSADVRAAHHGRQERDQMDAAVMPDFAGNAVRLQLHALAYNLGNFMRTLAMPKTAEPWSLTSLREKLVKIGAKVVSHGRYVTFQLAEVAVPRHIFAEILSLIARLRTPPAPA
jgi:hypothetical protein